VGYLLCPCGINVKFTHNKNAQKMKKILFGVALGAFAACGTGKSEAPAVDSLKLADSLKTDSLAKIAKDTTKKDSTAVVDTTKK